MHGSKSRLLDNATVCTDVPCLVDRSSEEGHTRTQELADYGRHLSQQEQFRVAFCHNVSSHESLAQRPEKHHASLDFDAVTTSISSQPMQRVLLKAHQ